MNREANATWTPTTEQAIARRVDGRYVGNDSDGGQNARMPLLLYRRQNVEDHMVFAGALDRSMPNADACCR